MITILISCWRRVSHTDFNLETIWERTQGDAMEPYIVQAEYSFQGENNDELRFTKGDIITVTQREDGGWWEGTLNEVTGWFPSNYVKEYKGKPMNLIGIHLDHVIYHR